MSLTTPAPDSLSVRMPLEEWFDRYQYTTTADIGESAVSSIALDEIEGLSIPDLVKSPLRYGHHQGLPELREAIAAQYPGLTAQDILVTAGASEAISLLATVLLTASSRAVVEHPTYPTMYLCPRSIGATVDLLHLRQENRWRPDWNEAADLLRGGAEFFAVSHPNNPTGSMIDVDELQSGVAMCREAGVRLVSDETYGLMTEGDPLPPAASLDERAVSISTMSKTFGLPGIRIGWIACRDRDLMDRLPACREHLTITNNALGERIALHVMRDPAPFVQRAKECVSRNRAIVADVIENHPRLDWVRPVAGVVGLPWIVGASDDRAEQAYRNLAEHRGTFVVPASGFELPMRYFRVGFGGEPALLSAGLEQLVAEIDTLPTQ